jgi:golgi-specific brefeldin A-resistance guanine nucleotide exchange factor 1
VRGILLFNVRIPDRCIPNGRQLDLDALIAAMRALEALAHERTVARLRQELDDINSAAQSGAHQTLPYDPVSVFLLEMMVSIACQAALRIDDVWYVTLLFWQHKS